MKKNKAMFAVIGVSVIVMVLIGFLVFQTYSFASTEFIDDGYVLTTVSENTPDDTVNAQYYFNKGTKFTKKYPEKVVFKNVDGDKVSLDTKNFLHYQSGSMSGLTKSVILDTDKLDAEQMSYYSVSNKSLLEITGKDYQISNGGEMISFSNFVWKISDSQYMVVSDEVKLYASENEQKVFDNYVELQYNDGGVVYLVNQEGTYSTVSSDAYLELKNGIQIFLGSKNISDGEVVLVNMAQMVIDSDDNIEIIPDEEYKNENLDTPTINIDVEDGEPGLDGDEGQQGEQGEAGTPGDSGETGENGNNGSNGAAGSPGASGGPGKPGDPGNQGESADNSDVIFNPETMPQFSAVLTTKPYGVNANVTYDNNGCAVSEVSASIIEKSSGAFVWGQNLGVPEAQFELNCDTLKQNTEYAFVISAAYTNSNTTVPVTQDVYKKLFVTGDLGVKLEKKYSTKDTIVLDLIKTKGSKITAVCVKYFDEDMNQVGFGVPLDLPVAENTGVFEIAGITEGNRVPVQFGGLEHNKAYYMQIEVTSLSDGLNVSIIPTNSFPMQKFMTLKIPPEIGKPKVTLSERTNSFIIEPSYVTDPDNGIMYYRYEIYKAEDIVADTNEKPDTPAEGDEQPGTVTTPVDNTNPSLDNMLSYMDNLDISTNEEGDTVIEKKGNAADESGDAASAEGEADSNVNIMAEPEDEQSGDTAGEASSEPASEPAAETSGDAVDQTGDEDWLSGLSPEDKKELLQSFQQFNYEKKTVLTSLAPMAKGTASTGYTINGDPVYTVERETAAKIDVPIDGDKIRRKTEYFVRIIGVFYDNEGIIEYSSPLSDVFSAGESLWPSVSNEIQDGYLTASTAEGTIYVTDSTGVIQGDLTLVIASSTEVNGNIRETVLNYELDTNDRYALPYVLKALKSQQRYTVSVYAEKMFINDKVYNNTLVGNVSFTTPDYSPLLVREYEATLTENSDHSFVAKISLQPEDFDKEAELRLKASKVKKMEHMGDLSARSLTSISFELYKENEAGTGPEADPFKLKDFDVTNAVIKGISDDAEMYDAQDYAFDSGLYEKGYLISADQELPSATDEFSIVLNESSFGLSTDDLADYKGDYIYIKVVGAYDYTYGRGGGEELYGDHNIIPIGIVGDQYDDSINDRYVKVKVRPIVPPFPVKVNNNNRNYNNIIELTKNVAEVNIENGKKYNVENSNVADNRDLSGRWNELDENTDVGVVIQGPTSLAKYSESVIYYIYDKSGKQVATSGQLPVDYKNKRQLPEWTYFLEADNDADTVPIKRGEKFYVETKVVLAYIYSPNNPSNKMLYPDEAFPGKPDRIKDLCILSKEEPRFYIIPWEGTATASNSSQDQLYFTFKDVDKALEYKDNGFEGANIKFYNVDANGDSRSLTDGIISGIRSIGGADVTGYYCLKAKLPSDGTLVVYYKLKETDNAYEQKKLFSENKVIKGKDVVISGDVNCTEKKNTSDDNTMSFEFSVPFQSSSMYDLARVDIDFSAGDKIVELKNREFNISEVQVGKTTTYKAIFTVKASELYTLAGNSVINYTVKLYYDDGKYGLKYTSTAPVDNMSNPYYALQDSNGEYKNIYLKKSIYKRNGFKLNPSNKTISMNGEVVKYLDYGMVNMPKSLSASVKSGSIKLKYVVPEADVNVSPGLSSALIDAKFKGDNTLVLVGTGVQYNAVLRYKETKGEWKTKNITIETNPDDAGQQVQVTLDGLTPGTNYIFEIKGMVYGADNRVDEKYIYEKGTFKTNPEITIEYVNGEDEKPAVEFIADKKYRDDKKVKIPFNLKNIFKEDLEYVNSVSLEIKYTPVVPEAGESVTVSSATVDVATLKRWFEEQVASAENKNLLPVLSCSATLRWRPDPNRKMDLSTTYTIEAKVNYKVELQDSATKFNAQITPSQWQTEPNFFITSKASSYKDSDHNDTFAIEFRINGNDKDRIIAGKKSDEGTLVLQLVTQDNTPVNGSIYTLDVKFDEKGQMETQTVTYGLPAVQLTANTTYKLIVHYNADYKNEGLSRAEHDKAENEILHNKTYTSSDVTTPVSASAYINQMVLIPSEDGGKVQITGDNLENTEIIKYTLTDTTSGEPYETVVHRNTDSNFGTIFRMEQAGVTWNQYILSVPNLTEANHSYSITVEFWEEGKDAPVAKKDGIYETQSSGGIGETLSRMILSWLS